ILVTRYSPLAARYSLLVTRYSPLAARINQQTVEHVRPGGDGGVVVGRLGRRYYPGRCAKAGAALEVAQSDRRQQTVIGLQGQGGAAELLGHLVRAVQTGNSLVC